MVLKSEIRAALEDAFDTLPEDEEVSHGDLIEHILRTISDAIDVYDDDEENEESEEDDGAVLFDDGSDED